MKFILLLFLLSLCYQSLAIAAFIGIKRVRRKSLRDEFQATKIIIR
ncbi:hypothetical protein [Zooshikella harenae]|uniref:Uncharacterized protein n=1 Tax=Zooshikella harenae TaxID=2827238 RepID=A0ABS5ZGD8_9GAMM|nr:hypothetical protein [Zooshikella harenae]MBU2713050.1 hypothetical protein [Zooshikella harenae]